MGFLNSFKTKLNEDALHPKFSHIPPRNNEIGIADNADDITQIQMDSDNSVIDMSDVEKFTTLSKYRDERYNAYEEMLQDPIIAAALEMYSDDATQMNRDGNIIWVEAEDQSIANAANRLLDVLNINKHVWKHIYSLCTYGDLYLRLYKIDDVDDNADAAAGIEGTMLIKPDDMTRRLEERVEYVPNPATVFDIQTKEKTSGFIRLKTKPQNQTMSYSDSNFLGAFSQPVSVLEPNSFAMVNSKSYVHISLSESISRFPQMLVLKGEEDQIIGAYQIKTGKSILEDAYTVSRQLKLLEDSLMLNRLTKSALLRILQVEVGDSPDPDAKRRVQRIKAMVEQKMSLNTQNGQARSYNNPGPMENIIYQATRNGKGAITETTIGGDVNVKDIIDIEFFQNRQLAALKIPKQFLNFDSPEGLGNGTSLTKVSSRYAHTVTRIQNAYIQGITTLLNIFFLDKGLDYINKFTVRMVNPSTVEEAERDEQLGNRINQIDDLMRLFEDYDEDVKHRIRKRLVNDLLQIPSLNEILDELDAKMTQDADEITAEENGDDFTDDDFTGDDFTGEDDFVGDEEIPDDFADNIDIES